MLQMFGLLDKPGHSSYSHAAVRSSNIDREDRKILMRRHRGEGLTFIWHLGGSLRAAHRVGRWGIVAVAVLALVGPWTIVQAATQVATPPPTHATTHVTVHANVSSGQRVGTTITWTASSTGLEKPVYRFSVAAGSGPIRVVRDFSHSSSFTWTPLHEGTYTVLAIVEASFAATSTVHAQTSFTIKSRVTDGHAVVSATNNPLVALYSAPACTSGSVVVQFRPATGTTAWQSTAAQPCSAGQSINVLVAGMRASTRYVLRHIVSVGTHSTTGTALPFTTAKPPAGLKLTTFTVKQAPIPQADRTSQVIFHALIPTASPTFANPVGTDLSGNVVWYYDTLHSGLTEIWPVRIVAGGTVLLFGQDRYGNGDNVLREVDLASNPVRETDVATVNAQLGRRGDEPIIMFHHDALRLPNGNTAVLGVTQDRLNGHNVLGDMIIVLDPNFQVVWTWDVLDHFTPPATFPTNQPRGAPICCLPDQAAIDWTHANGLGWSPQDGDLTLSFRQTNLVIKIAYQNGHGNGAIVWRLGQGGDFKAISADPAPWFSGQHNATLVGPNSNSIVIFDDGNVRCQNGKVKGCLSRGQQWTLDTTHHTATLVVNVPLGSFWLALGSTQLLANGNMTFTGGFSPPSRETEVSAKGTKIFEMDTNVAEYRAYWLTGMSY